MALTTLKDLYIEQLQDLYSAETQLADALPKLAEAASNDDLRQAFTDHLTETKEHANRVRALCEKHDADPTAEKCKAMEGLIKEANDMRDKHGDPTVHDAALIAAAQRIEHYEIAGYGTARALANELGDSEAADQLDAICKDEGAADERLNRIATGGLVSAGLNQSAPNG